MVSPSEPSRGGVDIDAVYAPGAAATEIERQESDEEAALGRSGANALLAVTIIELIGTTVLFFVIAKEPPDPVALVVTYGIVAVFAALYVWARSNPYPALITGLCLYIAVQLLAAIAEPSSLYQGIIVKVVVLCVLGGSIRNLRQYRAHARVR